MDVQGMTTHEVRHRTFTMLGGFLWWRLSNVLCGILLLSALGNLLMGAYVPTVVFTITAWGLHRGLRWVLTRRRG